MPERELPGSVKGMAKTPKKKPVKVREDLNQMAFRIVQEATGQAEKTVPKARPSRRKIRKEKAT